MQRLFSELDPAQTGYLNLSELQTLIESALTEAKTSSDSERSEKIRSLRTKVREERARSAQFSLQGPPRQRESKRVDSVAAGRDFSSSGDDAEFSVRVDDMDSDTLIDPLSRPGSSFSSALKQRRKGTTEGTPPSLQPGGGSYSRISQNDSNAGEHKESPSDVLSAYDRDVMLKRRSSAVGPLRLDAETFEHLFALTRLKYVRVAFGVTLALGAFFVVKWCANSKFAQSSPSKAAP